MRQTTVLIVVAFSRRKNVVYLVKSDNLLELHRLDNQWFTHPKMTLLCVTREVHCEFFFFSKFRAEIWREILAPRGIRLCRTSKKNSLLYFIRLSFFVNALLLCVYRWSNIVHGKLQTMIFFSILQENFRDGTREGSFQVFYNQVLKAKRDLLSFKVCVYLCSVGKHNILLPTEAGFRSPDVHKSQF